MPKVNGYIIKDCHGNFYLETIRSTPRKTVEYFLNAMKSPEDEKELLWNDFKKSGYTTVLVKIDIKDNSVAKKVVKKK